MAEDRVKRLRRAVLALPPEQLRTAAGRISEEMIRALPGPVRPLANQLRRSNDPAGLLRRLPNTTILATVADVLTDACLDATREALGDAADDPTMNQLQGALDTVLEDHDVSVVRVMLATVAVSDAEASDKCDELLTTDERFTLPDVDDETTGAGRAGARQGPSEEVLAKRRERKEADKARKAAQRERASQPKRKKQDPAPVPADGEPPAPVPTAARRAPVGVPAGFEVGDPLVGAVVVADVPFDDGIGGKTRPAVVIAVAADQVLVRPGYSEGGMQSRTWQAHEVRDRAAAGLTKPTWVEPDARTIARADVGDPIGRLSDDDWNALF